MNNIDQQEIDEMRKEFVQTVTRIQTAIEKKKNLDIQDIIEEIETSNIATMCEELYIDIPDLAEEIQKLTEPGLIFTNCIEQLLISFIKGRNADQHQDEVAQKIAQSIDIQIEMQEGQQNSIKIDIEVGIKAIFNHLQEYKHDLQQIFKNALKHFASITNKGLIEKFFTQCQGYISLFQTIRATQLKSGGSGDVDLLPDNFDYQLLPQSVIVKAYTYNIAELYSQDRTLNVQLLYKENQAYSNYNEKNVENVRRLRRFKDFLQFFLEQKICYPFIMKSELDQAVKEVEKKFFGIQEFMSLFHNHLLPFTSYVEDVNYPKGIVLYGPPGTGKSAIAKALCKALGLYFVTEPMAAGDLKKGIVGDSEKTVNAIANRARIVPWQMCIVFIDEIDSLAPDRNASSSMHSSEDLISVLLSTLDGAKTAANMKIIATTNLLNKIDDAFLRRMEIQLFLGNPSRSSREKWIAAKAEKFIQKPSGYTVETFINNPELKYLRDYLVNTTINFSADAYRKLLERYFLALIISPKKISPEEYEELLHTKLREISEEMKIYMGGKIVCEIIQKSKNLQSKYNADQYKVFKDIAKGQHNKNDHVPNRIMLIDLATKETHEKIKVQLANKNYQQMNPQQEEVYQRLSSIIYKNDQKQKVDRITLLFEIFYAFPNLRLESQEKYIENDCLELIEQASALFESVKSSLTAQREKDHNILQLADNWKVVSKQLLTDKKKNNKDCDPEKFQLEWYLICLLYDQLQMIFEEKQSLQTIALLPLYTFYPDNWAAIAIEFSVEYDADTVILVDYNYLIQHKAYDDNQAAAVINETVTEAKKYNRAVIIFDLDSLSGIKKDYHSLKEEIQISNVRAIEGGENVAQFYYHYQRPQCLESALNFMKKASNEGPLWFIAVSGHNKVILDFKLYINWPKTESEQRYEQEENEKDEQQRCKRCRQIFTPRENEYEAKCAKHRNNEFTFEQFGRQMNQEEGLKIYKAEYVEKKIKANEALPVNFKHTCCGQSVGGKGCVPCKHIEGDVYDPHNDNGLDTEVILD